MLVNSSETKDVKDVNKGCQIRSHFLRSFVNGLGLIPGEGGKLVQGIEN